MAIVTNAEEKFKIVIENLPGDYSETDFIEKFKELYPKDWNKILRRYEEHERRARKQKKRSHPMPNPEKYLLNILHKIRGKK